MGGPDQCLSHRLNSDIQSGAGHRTLATKLHKRTQRSNMKVKHQIAGLIRDLPPPFSSLACRCLAGMGLMAPWNTLYAQIGCPRRILTGVFSGMRYAPIAHGSPLLPKILGT